MEPDQASLKLEDEQPFVHEECGDSMWEPVLAQDEQPAAIRSDIPILPHTMENMDCINAAETSQTGP
jgi:hypothetical protein